MPYIKPYERTLIDDAIGALPQQMSAGQLNYAISRIVNRQLNFNGISYSEVNELVGVLECAKLELYRRIAVPYEDTKIQQNGDAYDAQS